MQNKLTLFFFCMSLLSFILCVFGLIAFSLLVTIFTLILNGIYIFEVDPGEKDLSRTVLIMNIITLVICIFLIV